MSDLERSLNLLLRDIAEESKCPICQNKVKLLLEFKTGSGLLVCSHECRIAEDHMDKPQLLNG